MNDKFAIIKLGGAQQLVHEGDILEVNRIKGEVKDKIEIKDILLVNDGEKASIGTPLVKGSEVVIEILEHTKGEKVTKQTYTAKARYRRKVGHRQTLTKIKIDKISVK